MTNIRMKFSSLSMDFWIGSLVALFSFIFAWHLVGGPQFDFNIPITYDGDGLGHSWQIKRFLDSGWYFFTEYTGYPFGSYFYDYTSVDLGNFVIIKILSFYATNYQQIFNWYFLLSFPVVGAVTFWVLRKLSVGSLNATLGAILFNFLPFHFLRINQVFYAWYFVIPLFVYFGVQIASPGNLFFRTSQSLRSKILP